jgi:uncharacterized membrane protein YcjF (UPF0283 family)
VGLYAVGQASLWVGAGLLLAGVALLVQGQTGCTAPACAPWVGASVTAVGGLGIAVGVPVVIANVRRIERVPERANPQPRAWLGPLSLRVQF